MKERLIELLKGAERKYLSNGINIPHMAEFIADYLLENGIIVPPCKVGDTIYMIVEKRAKVTREYFRFVKKTKLTFLNLERVLEDFSKTVFLTKEEAVQALRKEDEGK